MAEDPYANFPGLKIMSPADEVAAGLRKPGPLAGAVTLGAPPEQNSQTIRAAINPDPKPQGFLQGLKAAATAQKQPGDAPFQGLSRAAGNFDVAMGIKTPEQAASRAGWQGPLMGNMIEQAAAGNPVSRAGRAVGQGAMFAGQRAMEPGATPLNVGGNALLGAATGAVGLPASSRSKYGKLAKEQTEKLVDWFHTNVPSWKEFSGPRALYQMARGIEGQAKLSAMYEGALSATKNKVPQGLTISVPEDVAKAAGVFSKRVTSDRNFDPETRDALVKAGHLPSSMLGLVEVDARSLIDSLPSFSKDARSLKKTAMDAISEATKGIKELESANKEYMHGAGWMEMGKRLFSKGERFDPVEAQAALRKSGKEIFGPRGMGEVYNLMRGSGEQEIQKVTRPLWERSLVGAKVGGLLGSALGLSGAGLGVGVGAAAGSMIPKTAYKNLPRGPLSPADKILQSGIQTVAGRQLSTD